MEMKYEDFIEVLREVSESQGLNSGNILKRAQDKLKERSDENGIDSAYTIVYSTFKSNSFYKNYEFKLQMSDGTTASGTLLHFAIQCNNELLVKLLLENELSIVMKNYSGLPPLHIAASYGYENMVQLLLGNKRVNSLLKDAQGRTPREMVETIDNIQNREIIIKRLEKAEESYRTKLQNKAKNPLQDSHGAPASLTVNGDNVTTVLGNGKGKLAAVRVQVWDESKKENNGNVRSKQTSSNSITDESSGSTVNEQYQRVSVKNMVEKFEPSQKINITCSSKKAPAIESDGDDSGLELGPETAPSTSLHFEMNIDGTNNVERDVDNQTLESTLRFQIQLKDSWIRELEDSDEKLKEVEKKLEKAQEDLETLKDHLTKNETRLEALNKLDGENESLKQKIEDLESKNTTLNSELKESENKHSNYIAEHEAKLKAFNKLDEKNQSLRQRIQDLENKNTTLNSELEKNKNQHSQTSEVSLKKVEKKPPLSKIAYVSLVTTSMVGSILSIVSGLFVLSMIATSVTSALVAGGITYTMSKPTTELKEVNIQSPDNNKACEI